MPTIKIDGREIPFEPGDTIIRAAHRVGIDIPHYCWHPGLSVAANCRMCLVEVLPPPGRPAMTLDILRWDEAKGAYVARQEAEALAVVLAGLRAEHAGAFGHQPARGGSARRRFRSSFC